MGIFSGQRPEKMLSRAKARDKEEEIPRKQIPHFLAVTRKWDSCNESWDVFSGIQRELGLPGPRKKKTFVPSLRSSTFSSSSLWMVSPRLQGDSPTSFSKLVLGK